MLLTSLSPPAVLYKFAVINTLLDCSGLVYFTAEIFSPMTYIDK